MPLRTHVEERLRFTYPLVCTLSQRDSPRTVQAWLTGLIRDLMIVSQFASSGMETYGSWVRKSWGLPKPS